MAETTRIYRADGGEFTEVDAQGTLYDIVHNILVEDSLLGNDTLDISSDLARTPQGLADLFYRITSEVAYKLDPEGIQVIRSPEFTWKNRNCTVAPSSYCSADCKSLSILVASQLRRMGIPYYYKFVAYNGENIEHIYVVAKLGSREYVMDTTLMEFDTEVAHSYAETYNSGAMSQLGPAAVGNTRLVLPWKQLFITALSFFLLGKLFTTK